MTPRKCSKRLAAIGVVGCALLSQACGLSDDENTNSDLYIKPDAGGPPKFDAAAHDAAVDAAAPDAAHLDAAVDAAVDAAIDSAADARPADASAPDTGVPDASAPDTGTPDTSVPDASMPDTSTPDTSMPDTSVAEAGGSTACGPAAVTMPPGPAVCGDNFRASTEECDDGLGASTARRACSVQCQVLDELPTALPAVDAGVNLPTRTIGVGRHPLAVSDNTIALAYFAAQSNPPSLAMSTFSSKGEANGLVVPFSVGTTVDETSNPVLAAMPCDSYVAVWTQLDAPAGDELDVAIRMVSPTTVPSGAPAIANVTKAFSQSDPDVIWTGEEIVVAWVDTSNPATQPDVFYRTFDSNLSATSGEIPLAVSADSEADIALAPFAGAWAAAWRDDVAGLETIKVVVGAEVWTIGPGFLPAPVTSKPALTAIDATHLLVVYAVGADTVDSGVATASQLEMAVINTATPGAITQVPLTATVPSALGQSQSQPSAVVLGGNAFVAWWTAAATGDPNGEQLWLKEMSVVGGIPMPQLPEVSLPRWTQAEVGDQRSPALAVSTVTSGGAVVAAWDDLGRGLGGNEAELDTAVEFMPVPVLRAPGNQGGP